MEAKNAASTEGNTTHGATPGSSTAENQPTERGGLGGQRIGALVVGGVGVVGLTVGSFFGLQALSKKSEADKTCAGPRCSTDEGVQFGNDAYAAGNLSTVGMVVGGVGLVAGAVLWFTAPKRAETTQVGIGATGVTLRGAF